MFDVRPRALWVRSEMISILGALLHWGTDGEGQLLPPSGSARHCLWIPPPPPLRGVRGGARASGAAGLTQRAYMRPPEALPLGGCAQGHAHVPQPIRIVLFARPLARALYAGGTPPLCDRCMLFFSRLSLSAVHPSVSCVGRLYLQAPAVNTMSAIAAAAGSHILRPKLEIPA